MNELHDDQLDALADALASRVAERLVPLLADHGPAVGCRYLTASEVADRLGISRSTVYERADELGAMRIGDGTRPRLRFDPRKLDETLGEPDAPPAVKPSVSPRRPRDEAIDLLPVRGDG